MTNLTWKVSPAPTGKFRTFQSRGWPTAYDDKAETNTIAHITCADDYFPARVKTGDHAVLRVRLAIKNGTSFDWKVLKGEFATLDGAKAAAQKFYDANRNLFHGS